jgi:hypothetical protein
MCMYCHKLDYIDSDCDCEWEWGVGSESGFRFRNHNCYRRKPKIEMDPVSRL